MCDSCATCQVKTGEPYPVNNLPPATFASLLRRYRLAAGLTQAELAERAQLSQEAIGALERGTRLAPRKDTIELLMEALSLTESERAAFAAAARQHRVTNSVASAPLAAAPLEVTHPPDDGQPLPASSPTPNQIVHPARPLPSRTHGRPIAGWTLIVRFIVEYGSFALRPRGKLIAGLCIVLFLGTSLLAGSKVLPHGDTLCLATDFPLTYRFVNVKPVQDAIDLAVMQNQSLGNGYTLKVLHFDDGSPETRDYDPQIGVHNVQQMVRNHCIVGMVGPFNTDVAAAEMPIAANAGLVMISPSTSRSGLTLRPYAELEGWDFDQLHPPGKPVSFFRIAPTDVAQGLVAADFIFEDLGARNVFVVTDREQFGEDLVGSFTQSFEVKGGKIVGIESISNDNLSDIPDVAARIAVTKPDAVYYTGMPDAGGPLKARLFQLGYAGSFVGGDGLGPGPGFVELAGVAATNGTLVINSVAHPSRLTSDTAARYFHDFHARYPGENVDPYTAEAYDAAMVLITAMKRLIAVGQPVTRTALIGQVQHIQFEGVIGAISFDGNGDIVHGIFSLYRVQDGMWVYVQQLSA
jgi:branched-chain amino acid transport system substrate-binding protein